MLFAAGGACQIKLLGGILINVFLILTWIYIPMSLFVAVAALWPQVPGLVHDIHFYNVIM